MTRKAMDGMTAAAQAAYALSDAAMIFPITPASHMAETVESWAAAERTNLFGQPVRVIEMQSEKGVAGAVHGSLAGGALTSTFTASQGLLLMIPNMYKIAGELMPGVFHVTCRSLSSHALSIFGDHQDIMAVRQTGFAMLASNNVQECMDLSLVAHLSAIEGSVPFVHFFDGFRTSDQIETIEVIDQDQIASLVDWEKIDAFRARALEPTRPHIRGTAQNPDVYFQYREAANPFYDALPEIVQAQMDRVAALTGRSYHLFDYVGAPDAERVVVAMASACDVIEEVVNRLNAQGEKVGLVKVRLYRPFSATHLMAAIPKTARVICALDRTKEAGSLGEPLFQDLCAAVLSTGRAIAASKTADGTAVSANPTDIAAGRPPRVIGGRYGLSSKDFTPTMAAAVFENMAADQPLTSFTVGIDDDVTHRSLALGATLDTLPKGMTQCIFYGFGSDGTVGANKEAAKLIGDHGGKYVQCYSWFDSKKSGGLTISYVRFNDRPIHSPYLIDKADYVACHKDIYVKRGYDMIDELADNGVFVLNCPWSVDEMDHELPAVLKRGLVEKHARFFTIDAAKLAADVGLGSRINMIMQTVFFKLSGVMDTDKAIALLKDDIKRLYADKGSDVVAKNLKAVDGALAALVEVEIPVSWADAVDEPSQKMQLFTGEGATDNPYALTTDYLEDFFRPISELKGDDLPVSAMDPAGFTPLGTTAFEKRAVAFNIPAWDVDKCIQCYQCSLVCPHAAIRPYVATDDELAGHADDPSFKVPANFTTTPARLPQLKGMHFRIQVYPEDCVGCGSCADNCPAPGKALVMKPLEEQLKTQKENLAFAQQHISLKDNLVPKTSVMGTQLQQPLLEFSGACAGCGETPYVKLVTQLFGDRMIIANATGCSSIWGAYMPAMPYTVNRHGHGPAWANSLFEDNGEFGYGIATAVRIRRNHLCDLVESALADPALPEDIREALEAWQKAKDDPGMSATLGESAQHTIADRLGEQRGLTGRATAETDAGDIASPDTAATGNQTTETTSALITTLNDILRNADMFGKKSVWAIGGDGWAYDIDYDGIDAVLAKGENINILVLDTEGYSNTGGEESKATQLGSVSGFSLDGKPTPKKQLGRMMMQYGYVYVAQVCLGANMQQTITALREAEAYDGPSIVVCLCPCISWGIKAGMSTVIRESKHAVEAGYWPLFRFNPTLADEGKDPFILDYKQPDDSLESLLDGENRFASLAARKPTVAARLHSELAKDVQRDYTELSRTVDVYHPS